MKSFKQLALAAAVLSASFMAQAELKSMDDASMSAVTGQAGISIAGDFSGTVGNVAYIDDLGAGGGQLNLSGITMTGFAIDDAAPLTIDVKTVGGVQKLEIGLPTMKGTVTVANINIGGTYTAAVGNTAGSLAGGTSIGGLAISDLNMGGSAIRVWGH